MSDAAAVKQSVADFAQRLIAKTEKIDPYAFINISVDGTTAFRVTLDAIEEVDQRLFRKRTGSQQSM